MNARISVKIISRWSSKLCSLSYVVNTHYIYVGGYQATHFVGLYAAWTGQAYQLCIGSNSTISIS